MHFFKNVGTTSDVLEQNTSNRKETTYKFYVWVLPIRLEKTMVVLESVPSRENHQPILRCLFWTHSIPTPAQGHISRAKLRL